MVRKILGYGAAALALVLFAWGALHVFISPVNPDQEPPEKHVTWECWTCHMVSASAEIVDTDGS